MKIPYPQWRVDPPEVVEERRALGQFPELPRLFGSETRGEEFLDPPVAVAQGDHAVAGFRQGPHRIQNPLQHRVEIKTLVDAPTGLGQPGQAVSQDPDFHIAVVFGGQFVPPVGWCGVGFQSGRPAAP